MRHSFSPRAATRPRPSNGTNRKRSRFPFQYSIDALPMISGGYDAGTDVHLSLRPLPDAKEALARLTEKARQDLVLLAHPAADWVRPVADAAGRDVRDVIIVGAGQAGLIVGRALKRDGV